MHSQADTSMFVYSQGTNTLIFLLYADDIILTGSDPFVLHYFITLLSQQFAVKDLSELHYFLRVQVIRNSKGMFLTQQKYVHDLIHKFHMYTAKSVRISSLSKTSLTLNDGKLLVDPTEYKSMVGALIFDYD